MFTMQIIKALVATAAALLSVLIPHLGFGPALAASTTAPTSFWSYQEMSGPDHWAELDSSFATCSSGQAQSPINLTAAAAVDLIDPEFHYESVPLNLLNNGHTVQVPYAPGSYILLEGQQYNLLQFHFHSPSEHAIDGKPWDAELHLVHQSEAGELAVVAVLLQGEDAEGNSSYADLSANFPKKLGDKVRTGNMVDARSLLPKATTTYRYKGSLTTPPCSESVTWLVMTKPVSLSIQQLASYKQILNNNNRPLQLLNNRSVQLDSSP